MNEHVQAVLADVDAQIASLNSLRANLVKYAGGDSGAVAVPARAVQTGGRLIKKRKAESGKQETKPRVSGAFDIAGAHGGTRPTTAATVSGKPVSTVAGAMKCVISAFNGKQFTSAQVEAEMERRHGGEDFWKARSGSNISGNLSYWCKTGKLEKTDDGYRAQDGAFFQSVEY